VRTCSTALYSQKWVSCTSFFGVSFLLPLIFTYGFIFMTDSKLLSEKPLNDAHYEHVLSEINFSLSVSQFEKLSSFAILYESLGNFLEPFDSESPISEISVLLSHTNNAFYDFLDNLRSNRI